MNPVLTTNPGTCGCGCGQPVAAKRKFRQGHDAKLKSALIRAALDGSTVEADGRTTDALTFADAHGFGHQVRAGVERRAARKPRRKSETVAAEVTAKVGRWTYTGVLRDEGATFEYADKSGATKTADRFVVVS